MKSANFDSLGATDKVHVTMICLSVAMKDLGWETPAINGSVLPQNSIDWRGDNE